MKLVLTKHNEACPDGFRYTHADGHRDTGFLDKGSWLKAIAKHCTDNGLPQVDPADAIDQLCKLLPPGWCKFESGERPTWFIDSRLRVMDVLRGTRVLISELLDGVPLVSKELAASRSLTCSRCPFNIPISGCAPCIGLQGLIETIGGVIKTPSDASLRTCAVCRCSNKAQTRLPIQVLKKGVTDDMIEKFQSVPFCWKGQELKDAT